MKFMHLSDVRLGQHTESGRPWGEDRLTEISQTLRTALSEAEQEEVDLVLIAGGLFSHRPVTAELKEADELFREYPRMSFVIVAGEADSVRRSSPVRSFTFSPNVHFILEGSPEKITFKELYTEVYARSVTEDTSSAEELISGAETEDGEPIRIGLLYEQGLEKAMDFNCSGFSYVALGGHGSRLEVAKDKAFYSGGLAPSGMADQGEHGYLLGEISPVTGMLTSIKFVPKSGTAYVPLLIKIGPSTSPADLCTMLEREIERRGTRNIYRLRIAGNRLPDTKFDVTSLKAKYRIADFIDETEPQYDFEELFNEHKQDMIGYFISSIAKNRDDLPEIDKRAMFYGIDALLKTEETKK